MTIRPLTRPLTRPEGWLPAGWASAHRGSKPSAAASNPWRIVLLGDLMTILLVVGVAMVGREWLSVFQGPTAVSESVGLIAPAFAALWLLSLVTLGCYRPSIIVAGVEEYKKVLFATFMTSALVGIGCYLGQVPLSRGFFVLTFMLGLPGLVAWRYLLRRAVRRARRSGRLVHQVLIVGSPEHVDEVGRVLRRETWLGYHVVGALTPEPSGEETHTGIPVLGCSEDASRMCAELGADVLFVADGAFGSPARLREVAWDLEHEDVQVVIAAGVTDVSSERINVRPVGGLPLMHLEAPRTLQASRWLKRTFDVLTASLLVLGVAPVMLALALWIYIHDRGPVIFRQTRVGRDGSTFTCLKFRSMVLDAEERLAALKEREGFEGGLFKMERDPRITAPGRLIRRLSLDELPQLFNVIRGDMSLVGPRPPLPSEVAEYDGVMHRRLRVRPGLTGLWQVSGRSDLSFEDAIRLDLYYVDNWSMVQDLAILARTTRAVLSSRGAY